MKQSDLITARPFLCVGRLVTTDKKDVGLLLTHDFQTYTYELNNELFKSNYNGKDIINIKIEGKQIIRTDGSFQDLPYYYFDMLFNISEKGERDKYFYITAQNAKNVKTDDKQNGGSIIVARVNNATKDFIILNYLRLELTVCNKQSMLNILKTYPNSITNAKAISSTKQAGVYNIKVNQENAVMKLSNIQWAVTYAVMGQVYVKYNDPDVYIDSEVAKQKAIPNGSAIFNKVFDTKVRVLSTERRQMLDYTIAKQGVIFKLLGNYTIYVNAKTADEAKTESYFLVNTVNFNLLKQIELNYINACISLTVTRGK